VFVDKNDSTDAERRKPRAVFSPAVRATFYLEVYTKEEGDTIEFKERVAQFIIFLRKHWPYVVASCDFLPRYREQVLNQVDNPYQTALEQYKASLKTSDQNKDKWWGDIVQEFAEGKTAMMTVFSNYSTVLAGQLQNDIDFGVARIHRNAQHGAHRQRNRQRRNQMHMLVLQPPAQRLAQHRVRAFNQAIRHQNAHKQHHKMKMQHAKQHQHGNRQRNQKRLACVVACGGGDCGNGGIGRLRRGGVGGRGRHYYHGGHWRYYGAGVCDAGNHANYFTIFPHGMGIKRFPKFIVKPISPQPNSTTTLFIKWIWGNHIAFSNFNLSTTIN